jgi:peptide deformylase
MAIRRIRQLGDPILLRRSQPVHSHLAAVPALEDLRDTLHRFREMHGWGRGISAVQIGQLVRVIYIELDRTPLCLINPEYTDVSAEKFQMWDDCFSFPYLMVRLERSVSVRVRYLDENGEARELTASGDLSELLQHEMDHLDGILAVHRAIDSNSFMTREEWIRQKE